MTYCLCQFIAFWTNIKEFSKVKTYLFGCHKRKKLLEIQFHWALENKDQHWAYVLEYQWKLTHCLQLYTYGILVFLHWKEVDSYKLYGKMIFTLFIWGVQVNSCVIIFLCMVWFGCINSYFSSGNWTKKIKQKRIQIYALQSHYSFVYFWLLCLFFFIPNGKT